MADYRQEAAQEAAASAALREWIQRRIRNIHAHVTLYDVLRANGITLREDRPDQFSCPFHGQDKHPSARAYPASADSTSHAWCFVCQERWDAISIWRKFNGSETKFSRVLSEIEKAFGLDRPAFPEGAEGLDADEVPAKDEDLERFFRLYKICDRKLVDARDIYDLKGYLAAMTLLERLGSRVRQKKLTAEQGETVLRDLLEKIGKRLRACPGG